MGVLNPHQAQRIVTLDNDTSDERDIPLAPKLTLHHTSFGVRPIVSTSDPKQSPVETRSVGGVTWSGRPRTLESRPLTPVRLWDPEDKGPPSTPCTGVPGR